MYLNLDLLYNISSSFKTVFYRDYKTTGGNLVYSGYSNKAIQYGINYTVYFDLNTQYCYLDGSYIKIKEYGGTLYFEEKFCFFRNYKNKESKFLKCDSFDIPFADKFYLQSKKEIKYK